MARKSKSLNDPNKFLKEALGDEYHPYVERVEKLTKQLLENEAKSKVVSASTPQSTVNKREPMSDISSIIEYDEDLADAEAPVPLPKGDYTAEIRGAVKKFAKSGDKEYANITFFIDPSQYPADYVEGDPDGTILSYGMGRLSTAGDRKSRWNMKKFSESIGAELGRSLDLNTFLGKAAIVTVINEDYEGQTQAKISRVGAA